MNTINSENMLKSVANKLPVQSTAENGQLMIVLAADGTPVARQQAPSEDVSTPLVPVATLPSTPSASTMGKLYLVGPDGSGNYEQFITLKDDSVQPATYAWHSLGPSTLSFTTASTADCRSLVTDY